MSSARPLVGLRDLMADPRLRLAQHRDHRPGPDRGRRRRDGRRRRPRTSRARRRQRRLDERRLGDRGAPRRCRPRRPRPPRQPRRRPHPRLPDHRGRLRPSRDLAGGPAAYASYFMVGFGYACVEVASRTLLLRLGSDESLARVISFLETTRLGGDRARGDHRPGARRAAGRPRSAAGLRRAPAARSSSSAGPRSASSRSAPRSRERHFNLLRGSAIFTPLPIHTLEWLCRSLVEVDAGTGQEVDHPGRRRRPLLPDRRG